MKLPADPGAADGGEVPRVVGLDAFDIPKERLPGAVSPADGVPHSTVIGEPDNMEFAATGWAAVDRCTGDGGEVPRVVGLDAFDIPEERLPRAVSVADGVPHSAIVGEPDELQLIIDPGAADGGEVAR